MACKPSWNSNRSLNAQGPSCPKTNAWGLSRFWLPIPKRALRWAAGCARSASRAKGGGKRGGYRTIYVFGGNRMPLFLVTVFAKNEKDNLTSIELAAAVALSKQLLATYGAQP
jgi:hypothetical protein